MRPLTPTVSLAALLLGGCAAPRATGPLEGERNPDALVRRMSDRLAAARAFSVSTTEWHERWGGGGKREVRFSRQVLVRRPDRVAFTITGAEREGSGSYDGQHFTLVWSGEKAWAQVKMPPTIDASLDRLAERFKMPMPVGDLLYSSPYEVLIGPDTQGTYVGRESRGERECDHLSFSEEHVDWRIWIAAAGDPVPCQIEITSKEQSGPLSSRVTFDAWNLAADAPDAAFTAQVPAGFERILMVPRAEPAAAEGMQ